MVRFQYAQRCASRSVWYFNILSGGTLNGVLPVWCGTLTFYRVVRSTVCLLPVRCREREREREREKQANKCVFTTGSQHGNKWSIQ